MSIPADRLRQPRGADNLLVGESVRNGCRFCRRRPLLEHRASFGIDRRRIVPVLLVEFEYVPAVEPGKLLPPCHPLILPYRSIRGFAVRGSRFAVRGFALRGSRLARSRVRLLRQSETVQRMERADVDSLV